MKTINITIVLNEDEGALESVLVDGKKPELIESTMLDSSTTYIVADSESWILSLSLGHF